MGERPVDVGDDRALGEQESTVRLPHHAGLRLEARVGGVSPPEILGREDLVRKVVQLGGLERAAEGRPVLRAALQRAGRDQQLLAGDRLELVPELVAAPQQRDVGRMLVIREADDARQPVRRAELVQQVVLLEPQHAPATACQVECRCRSHAAEADDDRVVSVRHRGSVPTSIHP